MQFIQKPHLRTNMHSHPHRLQYHLLPRLLVSSSSYTSTRSFVVVLFPTTIGARDHAVLKEYKVFINPSLSEVLCTTIVEVPSLSVITYMISFLPSPTPSLTHHNTPLFCPLLCNILTILIQALAMGKWVVCAKHPSNEFFEQFPNCLTYRTEEEFAANVYWALHHDPLPLTKAQRYTLSWDAATERFIAASRITKGNSYRIISLKLAYTTHPPKPILNIR